MTKSLYTAPSASVAQRFCSPKCRRVMDSAARASVREEMASGRLTVPRLQRARCRDPGSFN
jgi:hypothetical protein